MPGAKNHGLALNVYPKEKAIKLTRQRRRTNRVNDLDLSNWRQYEDILTDSLWILDSRDSSGAHQADYHGNFIPQIPNQLLRRFTRAGETVLDPFIGSGTTAIEANRLKRRYIGIELSPKVTQLARQRTFDDMLEMPDYSSSVDPGFSPDDNSLGIINGDSAAPEIAGKVFAKLAETESRKVQFLIMHPPYHNIIKFSDHPADLSNCANVDEFVRRFLVVYNNVAGFLDCERYFALVIGDIYQKKEWIPLQNLITAKLLATGGLRLKSIIVKNMVNNRAKRKQEHLWRYRALANGFYIFKHEYIVVFQKTGNRM